MKKGSWEGLQRQLEEGHEWPGTYCFTFIVRRENLGQAKALFGSDARMQATSSRTGRYVSLRAECRMQCPSDVIALYKKAADIPVEISL